MKMKNDVQQEDFEHSVRTDSKFEQSNNDHNNQISNKIPYVDQINQECSKDD